MTDDLPNFSKYTGQKGQALLFVIVALTISLAIGIGVSVRTISSLSRTSRTDTASRVLAAAEGGIERYLSLSTTQLKDAVDGKCPDDDANSDIEDPDNTTNSCLIKFDNSVDNIISQAIVTVSNYEPTIYKFNLKSGEVKEVNLDSYKGDEVKICWSSQTSTESSDIFYFVYSEDEVVNVGGIKDGSGSHSTSYSVSDEFATANPGEDGYNNCYTVDVGDKPYGLRIRPLDNDAKIAVKGVGQTLPLQGFEIVSVGSLVQKSDVTASKTIKVVVSLPYLPAGFEFAIYSQGEIVK